MAVQCFVLFKITAESFDYVMLASRFLNCQSAGLL
jgi:hypothetical protein